MSWESRRTISDWRKLLKELAGKGQPMRILSMGGGVNSIACSALYSYHATLFADTGDEKPETYEYLKRHIMPRLGDSFVTVRNPANTLSGYCLERGYIPSMRERWCTHDYKIRPIHAWCRAIGATHKNPVDMDIAFALDESHRMHPGKHAVRYINRRYPLIDNRITRAGCIAAIRDAGLPEPPKSSCYFCPFASKKTFRELAGNHPELFAKARAIEENARGYPRYSLKGKPLKVLVQEGAGLDDYMESEDGEDSCESGHCFL